MGVTVATMTSVLSRKSVDDLDPHLTSSDRSNVYLRTMIKLCNPGGKKRTETPLKHTVVLVCKKSDTVMESKTCDADVTVWFVNH